MKKVRHVIAVGYLLLTSSCYFTEDVVPYDLPWPYALPSEYGMDEELLYLLDFRIKMGAFDNVKGVMAIKGGKMIYENYYNGGSRRELNELSTASMSVLSLLVGIAVDKGMVNSLDEPIYKYYQGDISIFGGDVLHRQISLLDLLQMKSGISWNEAATSLFNPLNDLNRMQNSQNWLEFMLTADMEALPGLRYSYNSGLGLIIGDVLSRASGMPFEEFARIHLFAPLDIKDYQWQKDPAGNINAGFGLSLSIADLTKIGLLMANGGDWYGKRIVSSNWIATSTTPKFQISRFNDFSYSWWNFSNLSSVAVVLQTNDAYYAEGMTGQYMFVVPHADMVVTVISENYYSNPTGPIVMLRNYFLPALPKQ